MPHSGSVDPAVGATPSCFGTAGRQGYPIRPTTGRAPQEAAGVAAVAEEQARVRAR